jgi:hypothetical protein
MHKTISLVGVLLFLKINATAQVFNSCNDDDDIIVNSDSTSKLIHQFSWDFENCPLDVSSHRFIGFDIKNNSNSKAVIDLQYESGSNFKNAARFVVDANQSQTFKMMIVRQKPNDETSWKLYFDGIRGYPGGYVTHWLAPDPSKIKKISLKINLSTPLSAAEYITFNTPYGLDLMTYDATTFSKETYPILDLMGQYVGDKWTGKLDHIRDLELLGNQDCEIYNAQSFQNQFSKYGGWLHSEKHDAKGYFYTKKINDRWWFIDPEGFLFWSLGINGVGNGSATKISGRSVLFPALTLERSEEKKWNQNSSLDTPSIFGSDRINFYYLNLKRKYGNNWLLKHQKVTQGRLKKWGVNTYGAWSNMPQNSDHPYTIIIHTKLQGIGAIEKLPDPFSYEFMLDLKESLQQHASKSKDPWLLGVFINNEIHWQHKKSFSKQILSLKNTVPARRAFEKFLKEKYSSIHHLNSNWGSEFKSFRKVNTIVNNKHSKIFKADMQAFFTHFVDSYYSLVRKEFKRVFPNHLYLGSRLHGKSKYNSILHEKAAKYCDVVSFNIYDYGVRNFKLLSEIDKPILIGEFHFGTASHGVWGSGLRNVSSIEDQADLYKQYIEEASLHSNIVGAHWFQWSDQPTTGRFDGENFRIGIVNITDQPYPNLVQAMQEISTRLYLNRTYQNEYHSK